MDASGKFQYRSWWAVNDSEERAAFEALMDEIARALESRTRTFITTRRRAIRDRNASQVALRIARAEQLDELLRAGRFVDLFAVTRESLRAGVEKLFDQGDERVPRFHA